MGHVPELRRDPLAFYLRCVQEFGDVVTVRFGWTKIFLVSHPDLIEQVLVSEGKNFIKHYALRMNRTLLGNGLLTSEGDFWLRQRRLIQPLFQRDRLAGYASIMVQLAREQTDAWHDGETRDLHADMTGLTLRIIAQALFGADVSHLAVEVGEALSEIMTNFNRRFFAVLRFPEWVPTPAHLRLRRAAARLDRVVYGLIEKRRREGIERDDLLSRLLRARDEADSTGMTDRQLRDEAMTLFLAGHDTTSLTLTWAWYLLACHPEAMSRLTEELKRELAGRPPTLDDLPRLRYAEMVVQEAMRLFPPAYAIGRQALHACRLGGYSLPAGATVLLCQYVVHRDPRWFQNPDKFLPERWASTPGADTPGLAARLPKYAYFPFGGGARICVGNTFAMVEAVLVLAALAQRFRVQPYSGPEIRLQAAITLRPVDPIRLTLQAQ